jgi:hypothetical protein
MKSVKDEGIVTQLAVVATMMPKVKEYIDQQANRIAELEKLTREPTKLLAVPDLMAKAGFFKRGERVASQIQTKPLSDEEIYELWCEADNTELLPEMRLKDGSINYIITTFAKLIEERHGIK